MKRCAMVYLFLICFLPGLQAQPLHEEITLENGQKYLVGVLTKDMLQTGPYETWFDPGYTSYQPRKSDLKNLAPLLRDVHILIFLGTWCGDSRREVPRFLRILDEAGFPPNRIKLVGVDRRKERYKMSPGGEEWGLNIRRVPTFIFLKGGKEIGRIVEQPVLSLEQDICDLLSCSPSLPQRE